MDNIGIAKMSSKGQIVIPAGMRGSFKEGDKLVFIQKGKLFVFQKLSDTEEKFAEDLIVAKRVAKAWKDVDAGRVTHFKNHKEMQAHFDKLKAKPLSQAPRLLTRLTKK